MSRSIFLALLVTAASSQAAGGKAQPASAPKPVLEPEAQKFVEATAKPPFLFDLGPVKGRTVVDQVQSGEGVSLPDVSVEDTTVPGGPAGTVSVRILRPKGAAGKLPVLVYLHGAGWVFGNNRGRRAGDRGPLPGHHPRLRHAQHAARHPRCPGGHRAGHRLRPGGAQDQAVATAARDPTSEAAASCGRGRAACCGAGWPREQRPRRWRRARASAAKQAGSRQTQGPPGNRQAVRELTAGARPVALGRRVCDGPDAVRHGS